MGVCLNPSFCYNVANVWRFGGKLYDLRDYSGPSYKQPDFLNKYFKFLEVPCNKCASCLASRRALWCNRMYFESLSYTNNCIFLTLTYNDDNLPLYNEQGDYCHGGTLVKRDLTLFWKRLRKSLSCFGVKIRYFVVGEYGEKKGRPHYHAVIYGVSSSLLYGSRDIRHYIESAWSQGFVHIGSVTPQSIGYIAKYVLKHHNTVAPSGYQVEFYHFSKGLGKSYILRFAASLRGRINVFQADAIFTIKVGGYIRKLGRYLRNVLFEALDFVPPLVSGFNHLDFLTELSARRALRLNAKAKYLTL